MSKTEIWPADVEAFRRSDLFDEEWYVREYPDVLALGMNPAEHYLQLGIKLKRKPRPDAPNSASTHAPRVNGAPPLAKIDQPNQLGTTHVLSDGHYLAMRQDVADSGFWDERWYLSNYYFQFREYREKFSPGYMSPLDHYLIDGWKRGYEPSDRLPLNIAQTNLRENKVTYFLNKLRFDGYQFTRNIWFPEPARIDKYLVQKSGRKATKVVYTCIVNDYDNLMQPYHIADDWDYVCFTDDLSLIERKRVGVWDIRPLSDTDAGSTRTNRWHKIHPHLLFPDYQESLYVDGNMNVISSYIFDEIENRGLDILLPKHFIRNCAYKEIKALLHSPRFKEVEKRQFEICREFLEKENFPSGQGLTENNVIYRRHHEKSVMSLMDHWWEAYVRFPPRDQTTLAYVFWKSGLDISRYTIANCRVNYRDFWIVTHNSAASIQNKKLAAKALRPAFQKDNIAAVFSTNEYFVPYLGVAIFSLIENSSAQYNYDIIILGNGLSEEAQEKLISLAEKRSNISIRYYDMKDIFDAIPKDTFHVEGYVPIDTYNKCFITKVLSGYDRCLYLDSDIVVVDDVQKLHDTPLEGNPIAASVNVANVNAAFCKKEIKGRQFHEYLKDELGVLDHNRYFQAGILLLDMKALEAMDLVSHSMQALKEVKSPVFFDQCIFNKVFYGRVKFVSTAWNHVWYMQSYSYLRGSVPEDVFFDYARGRVDPKIIHFASRDKPHTKYGWELGSIFWKYAYASPFRDEILRQLDESGNEVSAARQLTPGNDWYKVPPRLLVHVHLYYVDQLDTMLAALRNITGCEYTLFVTMVEKDENAERRIKAFSNDATVLVVPNAGYDIYPFLHVLDQVRLSQYGYILKLHTKNRREPGQDTVYGIKVPGYAWRDELIGALVGSEETFSRNLNTLMTNKTVGSLGARRFIFSTSNNREELTYKLADWRQRCGVTHGTHYVGGSMFLARAYPFERLKGLRMRAEDFKAPQMATKDYKNTAHIFERLLGIVIESEGFEIQGV